MKIAPFKLERYFARWEFAVDYMLSGSDMESYRMSDLLVLADDESRRLWDDLALCYTEAPGHPLLRAEIASLYEGIAPEQVLTFAGAEEGIFALVNVLLGPGDHAVVTWPAYQSLYSIAEATGAEVTLLELQEAEGWRLDIDALRSALRPNTRLIVVNSPHNPTGTLLERETFDALIALTEEAGITLLSDEVYRWLEHDPAMRLPAAAERSARAISVGVMSKAFGLAGLRVGWLVCQDMELLAKVAAFKDYTTICNSAPSEILSLIALRAKDTILTRNRGIVLENLALLDSFFARHNDLFSWVRPAAGCIAFPKLHDTMPIDWFTEALIEEEGVLLLPGTAYDHDGNNFRIGFGRLNFPEGLERVERFVQRHLK